MTGSNSVLTSDYLCAVCGEHANEHGAIPHQFVARNSNELLPFWNKAAREKLRAVGRDRMSTEAWQICESLLNRIDQLEAAALETRASVTLLDAACSFHEAYCPTCPDECCSLGKAIDDNETLSRDQALQRIECAQREIEILCDHLNMDPAEFLADSRAQKAETGEQPNIAKALLAAGAGKMFAQRHCPNLVGDFSAIEDALHPSLKAKVCQCDPSGQGALPCPVHDSQSEEPCASK
jgi:hypothetical protein